MKRTSNKKYSRSLLFVAISALCSGAWSAEGFEETSRLKSLVEAYVIANVAHDDQDEVSVVVSQIDNLKLQSCQREPTVAFPAEASTSQPGAVIISCSGAENWNVYVPVQVQVMTKVLSVNRLIPSGETIGEQDLSLVAYDRNRLYDGFFRNKDDVIGLSAARPIMNGMPLNHKNVKQVAIIKRNQTITLAVRRASIEIEMVGVAKTDGFLNGPVKVYNPSSKKFVDAIVVGKNRAEITY